MDNIEKLLGELKKCSKIWKQKKGDDIRFSGKFLDTVGEIFEKHGFGTTKIYLQNQMGRDRPQAFSLLIVLDKFRNYHEIITNRAIGRYVIKTLQVLGRKR